MCFGLLRVVCDAAKYGYPTRYCLQSTLALLVARIAAHDADHTAAANDLTLITNTLYAGFNFHRSTRLGPKRTRADDPLPSKRRETLEYKPS
jgi:hypothetical protein